MSGICEVREMETSQGVGICMSGGEVEGVGGGLLDQK